MKKFLAFLSVTIILLGLVACSQNSSTTPTNNERPTTVQADTKPKDNSTQTENNKDLTNWGVTGRFSARSDKGTESCYINLPVASGATTGYGMIVVHADKTAILYAGQNDKAPAITSLSELFPAYFERLEYDLKAYYGFLSENYKFALSDNESVSIGDYGMHRFTGNIEFDNDGKHCKYSFVAYATQLKSNGAYAYWVVYDTSDGQTNEKLIAEHALNMAKTFREEQ